MEKANPNALEKQNPVSIDNMINEHPNIPLKDGGEAIFAFVWELLDKKLECYHIKLPNGTYTTVSKEQVLREYAHPDYIKQMEE